MKKDDIVQAIADSADLSKADADRALKAVVDTITSGVASGEKIQIPGLGNVSWWSVAGCRSRSANQLRAVSP